MKTALPFFSALERQVDDIKKFNQDETNTPTIFSGLLDEKIPESERSNERLLCEAKVLIAAGTDTTATTMSKIVFHLLSDPVMLKKLKAELEIAIPDADSIPTAAEVENLPYLNAIIQEALRLHPAGTMRQERVAPDEDLVYEDDNGNSYTIPRGFVMAMTAPLLSRIETLYPSPNEFRPERYIENPQLAKYSLTFSRGPRICLGMNLAYMEMYIILAGIFRKYGAYDGTGKQTGPTLELFETTREDVDLVSDFAIPFAKEGSSGVRVIVR